MITIENVLNKFRKESRHILTESESKEILTSLGITVTRPIPVSSKKEAIGVAESLGFPIVLKVESTKIIHKSEVGGGKVGIKDKKGLGKAYQEIMEKTREIDKNVKVTVQKMVEGGVETIVGIIRDPQFGHAIMFGLGGIWVELLNDISLRIIPIDLTDADEMIHEIRSHRILSGYRGIPPANKEKLKEFLVRLSKFVCQHPQIEEMDLNPVFILPEDIVVADARIFLGA